MKKGRNFIPLKYKHNGSKIEYIDEKAIISSTEKYYKDSNFDNL